MTASHIPPSTLSFNGVSIRDRGEMLSLTDMWKAQGSDPARQPANWLASADARHFIEVLSVLEPGNSGVQTKRGGRGIGGSTFAHWQIGLAYAKYLSPEFHMWCNTVVRERMEGRPAAALVLDEGAKAVIGSMIKRCTGVVLREQLAEVVPQLVAGALLEGGHVVSTEYKPALQILIDKKVPAKRRRAFSQKVSSRLRRYAASAGKAPRLSRETGRYLFHVEVIKGWLEQEGNALIASHVASLAGQGVLPFRKKP